MNDKDNIYIFDDDENDNLEIAEYLERELEDMDEREKNRIRRRERKPKGSLSSTEKKPERSHVFVEKKDRSRSRQEERGRASRRTSAPEVFKSTKEKNKDKKKREIKKPKILLYYESHKLKVLWCTLGVLVVALLAALITTNISKSSGSKNDSEKIKNMAEKQTADEAKEETTEEITTEPPADENTFEAEPADSPYIQVCESFLKNTYVQWNDEALSQICDNTQNLSKDNYTYLNKYIEDIQNVNCYVGYETEDGKILVFVTYDMKFANISTGAPAMEAVVMVRSQDGNGYLIHNFEVGDEMDLYTSNVQNNQNYLDLCSNINTQLSVALESDADLKKVYDVLNGIGGE